MDLREERQGSSPLVLEKSSKHWKKVPKLGRSTATVGSVETIWTIRSKSNYPSAIISNRICMRFKFVNRRVKVPKEFDALGYREFGRREIVIL